MTEPKRTGLGNGTGRPLRDSGCFEEHRNAETVDITQYMQRSAAEERPDTSKVERGTPWCPLCAIHSDRTNKEVRRLHVTPIRSRKYWLNGIREPVTEQQLFSVSEAIGMSWFDVGAKLGIPLTVLQSINTEHQRVKEKAVAIFMLWRQQNGKKATGTRLAHALIAAGRLDVAETLAGGDPWLLQLTVEGVPKTQERVSTKGCYYICTDTCGGKTYLVSEIDRTSFVIDGEMLVAQVTGLWNELRGLEIPFTIEHQSDDVAAQLMQCGNINRRLQGLDTQLLNLTGEAGQTKNFQKPETIQSVMVLKECALMLRTLTADLANRIDLLQRQYQSMEEAQRRQLEILQTSQEGIPEKINRIGGILDVLLYPSVGSRNSAPSLSEFEQMWPDEIVRFLSQSIMRRPHATYDTRL